ncbi:MAG: DUF6134 family protein [Pseudomonadota bacterium]
MTLSLRSFGCTAKTLGAVRSTALFFAATTLASSLVAAPALAKKIKGAVEQSRQGDIVFAMDRKGDEIGHHSVTYTPLEDGRLQVDVAITIKVKFAFIVAYRYEHLNREIWSADGKTLLSIESETFNNGKNISISGKRTDAGFAMIDEDGTEYLIEGDIAPTSYWNALLLEADSAVLNTQKGKVADVAFINQDKSDVVAPDGTAVTTALYESQGELERIYVDYTPDNACWVGLEFFPPKQDVEITYRLTSYFAAQRPDLAAYPRLDACQKVFLPEPIPAEDQTLRLTQQDRQPGSKS